MRSEETRVMRSDTGGFVIENASQKWNYGPFYSASARDAMLRASEAYCGYGDLPLFVAVLASLKDFEGLRAEIVPAFAEDPLIREYWEGLQRLSLYYLEADEDMAVAKLRSATYAVLIQVAESLEGADSLSLPAGVDERGSFKLYRSPELFEGYMDHEILTQWFMPSVAFEAEDFDWKIIRI